MAKRPQNPALVWSLRACLLLQFCSALGMIIYALILENPPQTALPLGLLIVGCVSMLCVLIGLVGSLRVVCCLSVYLVLGTTLTLAELAITLSLFFNVDATVDAIYGQRKDDDPSGTQPSDKAEIKTQIEDGRWFFLVVCVLQLVSVLVAVVLRVCVYPRERDFEEMAEGGEGEAAPSKGQVQMQKLQSSIGGRSPLPTHATTPGTAQYASARLSKSTTQKMSAKYGEYSHDAAFQKKGFFGRLFGK